MSYMRLTIGNNHALNAKAPSYKRFRLILWINSPEMTVLEDFR